jgi:hypothetical protein
MKIYRVEYDEKFGESAKWIYNQIDVFAADMNSALNKVKKHVLNQTLKFDGEVVKSTGFRPREVKLIASSKI